MSNSKYEFEALVAKLNDAESVTMKFEELRELLGSWTDSAEKHQAWWSGKDRHHLQPLFAAGYKAQPDLKNKEVTFVKVSDATVQSNSGVKSSCSAPKCNKKSCNNNKQLADGNMKKVKVETAGNQKILTVTDENGKEQVFVFEFLDDIRPKRDQNGIIEYAPKDEYYNNRKDCPLNKHGRGPFCTFSIANAPAESGVYLWIIQDPVEPITENNENIIYIGETENFKKRFGGSNYGTISLRNCYKGGQSTNCKMNHRVWCESKKGNTISIYFYATPNHKAVEKILLSKIDTPYNVKDN
ncbi:hypothetical protein J5690_02670 [bacterium]|nr:hypothetical protein [bacterium]